MTKQRQLDQLAQEIEQCSLCKKGKTGKMVFGEGDPDAKIMFVGEAPGKQEAATGQPFIGRSGKLLRSLIREAGLSEDKVYITSPVKYLPDRGTPSASDITHAKIHFDKQVAIINPKLLVLLGSTSVQAVLGEKLPIKKIHGEVKEKNGIKYFITLHPAAALRFPPLRQELEKDFKKLQDFI